MARRRAIALVLGGLLALAAALTALSGAVLAGGGPHVTTLVCGQFVLADVTAGTTSVEITSVPAGPFDTVYSSLSVGDNGPFSAPPGNYHYQYGEQGTSYFGDFTIAPCASPSPSVSLGSDASASASQSPSCFVVDVAPNIPAQPVCPTASPSPSASPSSFESFQGETATPGSSATPPPTSTVNGSSSGGATPLFALLICLALGGLGLTAAAAQRRTIRR